MELSDIITSVESGKLIKDLKLKNGTFEKNSNGSLKRYSGGFTIVFPVIATDGKKWAFRCWHSNLGAEKKRYEILSEEIKRLNSPYLVPFEYVSEGIVINGKTYPTTRMEWVEALPLNDYLKKHQNDKKRLRSLVDEFVAMCNSLHKQQIAHGDLQHGNILVTKEGKLKLVDYDSMYVPKLTGFKDIIAGKAEYQHPTRAKNEYMSEKIDYFSELVIYICLYAASINPHLISEFNIEDSLFFKAEDFINLEQTLVYNTLSKCSKRIVELLNVLASFIDKTDLNQLYPLEAILLDFDTQFEVSSPKIKRGKQNATLKWNVGDKCDVEIFENDKLIRAHNGKGELIVSPNEPTTYRLEVKNIDGITIVKNVSLEVFDEAVIKFSVDKEYSLEDIPVKISWEVKNAVSVFLENEKVDAKGSKVVYPKKETVYKLKVIDKFGEYEEKITIKMLPLPLIKTILAPYPELNTKIEIKYKPQVVNAFVKVPTFNFPLVEQHVPLQPTLKELGLYVTLKMPKQFNFREKINNIVKLIKNHSIWKKIKRNYFRKKR